MEEPGMLQSMESQREGHDWATEHTHNLFYNIHAHSLIKPVFTVWSKGQVQQTWNLDWDKPEYKAWLYPLRSIINVYGPHILIVKMKINIMLAKTGSSGVIQFNFSSVTQTCPTLCDLMDCWKPGFPVHHQLLFKGSQRVRHNWVTKHNVTIAPFCWRRMVIFHHVCISPKESVNFVGQEIINILKIL